MKGIKKLLVLLLALLLFVGCASQPKEADTEKGKEDPATAEKAEDNKEKEPEKAAEVEVSLKRAYSAPHGTKSFARIAVVMAEDKIVGANIEEFQFGDAAGENTFVPNSDGAFAEGYAEGKALYSKRVNNELYSANMKKKAEATQPLLESYKAIEDFVKGKTVAELEEVLKGAKPGEVVDAISASTLVDTYGYVQSIIDAAKSEDFVSVGKVEKVDDLKIGFAQYAAHGDKAFADTVIVVSGETIVAANLDEFQFLGEGTKAVPNSDADFGKNYAEGKLLGSKKVNNETYSANMKKKAEATQPLIESYKAIEEFVAGKTIADVENLISESTPGKVVDAISSSTLVDTVGYLQSIIEAAKSLQ